MKKPLIVLALAGALASLGSCETDSTVGQSIVQDEVNVLVDSSFTISGQSVEIEKVQSRTVAQLLGRIDAKGFGSLESSVVTQFMPSVALANSAVTAADIDSLMLYMYMATGEYVGDSISPIAWRYTASPKTCHRQYLATSTPPDITTSQLRLPQPYTMWQT